MSFDRSSLAHWRQQVNLVNSETEDNRHRVENLKLSESQQNASHTQKQQESININNQIATAKQLQSSLPTLDQSRNENKSLLNELGEQTSFFNYLTELSNKYSKIAGNTIDTTEIAAEKLSPDGLLHTDLLKVITKENCKEAFDKAIIKISNIDYQDSEGKTLLIHAIINGFYYAVDCLLQKNPNINIKDKNGADALFYCSQIPHVKYFKLIAEKTNNINYRIPTFQNGSYIHSLVQNALNVMYASEINAEFKNIDHTMCGKLFNVDEDFTMSYPIGSIRKDGYSINQEKTLHLIKFLYEKGADINLKNDNGVTPFYLSCALKLKYIARQLINHYQIDRNIIDNSGFNILQWLLELNDKNMIETEIDKGSDVNHQDNNGKTTLFWAVFYQYHDIVNMLFEKYDAKDLPTKAGLTAWDIATFKADEKLIDILITKRDTPREHVEFWCACLTGNLTKVEELLNKGINPEVTINNIQNTTPLMQAIGHKHVKIIELLLKNKAEINKPDDVGASPLFYALGYQNQPINTNIAIFLISKGANVNQTSSYGCTPLHLACYNNNVMAAKILIDNGALKNVKNSQNKTALDILDDKIGLVYNSVITEMKLLF